MRAAPPPVPAPLAFEAVSDKQHSEAPVRPPEISLIPSEPELGNFSQISPSDFEDARQRSRLRDPFEPYGHGFGHQHEARSQDPQSSQFTENRFPFTSDINEEEGMEPVFHQEYRKVSRLDSPKMSIASSQRNRSFRSFFFREEGERPDDRSDMLSKMQKLCAPSQKGSLPLKLLPMTAEDSEAKGTWVFWGEDIDRSQQSHDPDHRFGKGVARKSRKNSRKNSSVENLIL